MEADSSDTPVEQQSVKSIKQEILQYKNRQRAQLRVFFKQIIEKLRGQIAFKRQQLSKLRNSVKQPTNIKRKPQQKKKPPPSWQQEQELAMAIRLSMMEAQAFQRAQISYMQEQEINKIQEGQAQAFQREQIKQIQEQQIQKIEGEFQDFQSSINN